MYLIEMVLVSARRINVVEALRGPVCSDGREFLPAIEVEDIGRIEKLSVDVRVYGDYLRVGLGEASTDRWMGANPVIFGQSDQGGLSAICVGLNRGERDVILSSFD